MSERLVKIPACPVVRKGEGYALQLPEYARDAFEALIKYCIKYRGGFICATYTTPKKPRTTGKNSQNAHINGHIQDISIFTGQPFNDLKKYLKQQAITRGYPMLLDDNGEPVMDLWGNVDGISESDASTEDAALLIDTIHQMAAELGITLKE